MELMDTLMEEIGLVMEEMGLLHIYTGDGKGKTTAAIGQAVRAKGAGFRVLMFQFLKGGETSELAPLAQLGIPVHRTDKVEKFTFEMNAQERALCSQNCIELLQMAHTAVQDGNWDMVILDEVLDAVRTGMIPEEALLALVDCPGPVEVILTGRSPSQALQDRAHYLTVMTAKKHPFHEGLLARRGVEF